MTNHVASLTWTDYFYLNAFWLVNLGMGQVALEDKTVYLCQKSVITIKNQVRPVCSPKDKTWSQTDKLQRCRRLPLEQAKLRQILENNSEGVLIRKWFDRWYVAESLCYRLLCKTFSFGNNMNPGAEDQFFPYEYPQYPPGWIYPLAGPSMFNDRGNPSPFPSTTSTDSLPESLRFSEDLMPPSTPCS